MENPDWDSVLQFVSDSFAMQSDPVLERPIAEKTTLSSFPPTPSQVPTPPQSDQGSSPETTPDPSSTVSVSTTFYPGANLNPLPPDLILLSSDSVFFYVHSHHLLSASENGFNSLLPVKHPKRASPPPRSPTNSTPPNSAASPTLSLKDLPDDLGTVLSLPESASVLNVLLHTVYHISCAHYAPALDTLLGALDALPRYGMPPARVCAPSTPLFSLILAHAPFAPIEAYAAAAHHDLYDLAVPISSHLLGYPLSALSDTLAERMGAVYLKRLFFLHLGRIDALKRLLLPPPHPHAPTPGCDFMEQKKLTRAWALASAYLAWDARPDLSTSAMEAALCPLGEHLSCDVCKKALAERTKQLIVQWSVVKDDLTYRTKRQISRIS